MADAPSLSAGLTSAEARARLAKDGPNKGKRAVNGWKNIGLPWSYDLDKARLLLRE